MEWISVKDKMPEQGIPCLLYQTWPPETMFNCRADPLKRTFIKLGGLNYQKKFVLYEDQYSGYILEYVTHWMPLPKPPLNDCDGI